MINLLWFESFFAPGSVVGADLDSGAWWSKGDIVTAMELPWQSVWMVEKQASSAKLAAHQHNGAMLYFI